MSSDRLPVDSCEVAHRYEVIDAAENCSAEVLIRYLGGDPTIEVLRATSEEVVIGNSNVQVCAVDGPTVDLSVRTVKNVLTTSGADGWRLCLDSRTNLDEISCAEPHTGEYVKPRLVSGADAVDCVALAEGYMNAPYKRVGELLRVRTVRTASGPDCLVEVLGRNVLTASLRDLGVSAIPREPG